MSKSRRKERNRVRTFREGKEPHATTRPVFNANASRTYTKKKRLRSRSERAKARKATMRATRADE